MFYVSCVRSPCLLGAVLLLGGCAVAPNSFRIDAAQSIRDSVLYPPGTSLTYEKLDLHIERTNSECQSALPTRTSGHVTVSNPYWPAVDARVVRIEIARAGLSQVVLPPPASCLKTSVRPAPQACAQDWIVKSVEAAIAKDTAWEKCLPSGTPGFAEDVVETLPHRASESGALRLERTYTRPLVPPTSQSRAAGVAAATFDVEFVSLLPGATVCVNKDQTLGTGAAPWVSSAQSCVGLLQGAKGQGSVVLSRTDTENTFPLARQAYDMDEAVVFDARSWLAVRGAVAALMPHGAFLYVYYPGEATNTAPDGSAHWEYDKSTGVRRYKIDNTKSILPLSPILVAHSQPLQLTASGAPHLDALCHTGGNPKVIRLCFDFRDFAAIDVLHPYVVNGRAVYAPSGTLTTDVPGIAAVPGARAMRVFRGRSVPLAFDWSNPRNAIPLAANDQFKGTR